MVRVGGWVLPRWASVWARTVSRDGVLFELELSRGGGGTHDTQGAPGRVAEPAGRPSGRSAGAPRGDRHGDGGTGDPPGVIDEVARRDVDADPVELPDEVRPLEGNL